MVFTRGKSILNDLITRGIIIYLVYIFLQSVEFILLSAFLKENMISFYLYYRKLSSCLKAVIMKMSRNLKLIRMVLLETLDR